MPKLFRHSGRIRNKHLSKRDTEKLVKEMWKERMNDPGGLAGWRWAQARGHGVDSGAVRTTRLGCAPPAGQLTMAAPPLQSLSQLLLPAARWTCWSLCSSSCRRKWASSPRWWRCARRFGLARSQNLLMHGHRNSLQLVSCLPCSNRAPPVRPHTQAGYNFLFGLWKYQWDADCELFMRILLVGGAAWGWVLPGWGWLPGIRLGLGSIAGCHDPAPGCICRAPRHRAAVYRQVATPSLAPCRGR